MNPTVRQYVVTGAIAAVVVAVLAVQQRAGAELRGEVSRLQFRQGEQARLAAENRRLAAAQVPAAELEGLRADEAAVAKLRQELADLRRRTAEMARAAEAPATPPARSPLLDGPVEAGKWRNAGRATPDAAFETVLWAAAGGDVDLLAGSLSLDADARAKAEAILAGLPEASRAEMATPERLVALLTAKAVPLGSAQILGKFPHADETKVVVRLQGPEGKTKTSQFSLRAEGPNWRLVVPGYIVDRYLAALHRPAPVAAAGK